MKKGFFLLAVFIFGCSQMTNKYEPRYNLIKEKIRNNRKNIESMLSQLPHNYQREMKESIDLVESNSVIGFLNKTKMSNQNFELFLKSVEKFISRLEAAKSFVPDKSQRELYDELRRKVLEREEDVRKLIESLRNSNNVPDITLKVFLTKILNCEIEEFLSKSIMTEEEFDKQIKDFIENWELFETRLALMNFDKELDKILEGTKK